MALGSSRATAVLEKEEGWQRGGPRGRPQQLESHTPGLASLGSPPPSRGAEPGRCWPVGHLVGSWFLGQWPVTGFLALMLESVRDTGAICIPEPPREKLRSGIQVSGVSLRRLTAIPGTEYPQIQGLHE